MSRSVSVMQAGASAYVLAQLSRGRPRREPLTQPGDAAPGRPGDTRPGRPGDTRPGRPVDAPPAHHPGAVPRDTGTVSPVIPTVTVIVPARNERTRIGPCLDGLTGDPAIAEVIVVDDGSSDGTGAFARDRGARVLTPGEPPAGWDGKSWALQRGLEEANGEIVLTLDADTRPRPGLAAAVGAALGDADLLSVGARFRCDGPVERWLHAALLASLVYRFGPPDTGRPLPIGRLVVNGQCLAARRAALLDAGGFTAAAGHFADDAALARTLARRGWRVVFRDGGGLLSVDMHDSAIEVWREWGRTIALRDVTSALRLAADVLAVWLTLGLPPLRLLTGRARAADRGLLGLRALMTIALASAYERRGAAYWLSPLADPLAAVRVTLSAAVPARGWRGRAMR